MYSWHTHPASNLLFRDFWFVRAAFALCRLIYAGEPAALAAAAQAAQAAALRAAELKVACAMKDIMEKIRP
jgi:hypothetical protein